MRRRISGEYGPSNLLLSYKLQVRGNEAFQKQCCRDSYEGMSPSSLTSMTVRELFCRFRCIFQRLLTVTSEPSRRLWISWPFHDNFSRVSFSILASDVGNFVLNKLCVRAPITSCAVHP